MHTFNRMRLPHFATRHRNDRRMNMQPGPTLGTSRQTSGGAGPGGTRSPNGQLGGPAPTELVAVQLAGSPGPPSTACGVQTRARWCPTSAVVWGRPVYPWRGWGGGIAGDRLVAGHPMANYWPDVNHTPGKFRPGICKLGSHCLKCTCKTEIIVCPDWEKKHMQIHTHALGVDYPLPIS